MEFMCEPEKKVSARVKVVNPLGLHLRPAAALAGFASHQHRCELYLGKNGHMVNIKSIMGVVMLAAEQGSELLVEAWGESAEDVVTAIIGFFNSGFNMHFCQPENDL